MAPEAPWGLISPSDHEGPAASLEPVPVPPGIGGEPVGAEPEIGPEPGPPGIEVLEQPVAHGPGEEVLGQILGVGCRQVPFEPITAYPGRQ